VRRSRHGQNATAQDITPFKQYPVCHALLLQQAGGVQAAHPAADDRDFCRPHCDSFRALPDIMTRLAVSLKDQGGGVG
jgi:hypothetical protein